MSNPFASMTEFAVDSITVTIEDDTITMRQDHAEHNDDGTSVSAIHLNMEKLTHLMKILEVIFREEAADPEPLASNPAVADGKTKVKLK